MFRFNFYFFYLKSDVRTVANPDQAFGEVSHIGGRRKSSLV